MKHTPGPWQIHGSHVYGTGPDRKLIAQVLNKGDCEEHMPIIANARLIAAAPDLLAALKALLCMLDRGPEPKKFDDALSWRENDEKAKALAISAIAKAES